MRSTTPKFVIILTQDTKNISVHQIADALRRNIESNYQVLIWDVNTVRFSGSNLVQNDRFFQASGVPLCDIVFAIKRTWSAIRSKSLAVCQGLERHGISVFNGCEFIEWSHSKIKQFRTLPDLFPNTVCFDAEFMRSVQNKEHDEIIQEVIETVGSKLQFPAVFKTNEGCRGDGIFLVHTLNDLILLMRKMLSDQTKEFKNGFLLQEFISTHTNPFISNYYRINLVGGRAQSAVQFQMLWKKTDDGFYKLSDFPEANDVPVDVNGFPDEKLNEIVRRCPGKVDGIGIDVVMDTSGKLLLLEYNDGPVVSQIVSLGEKFLTTPGSAKAAKACTEFPDEIAKRCLPELAKKQRFLLSSKL